MYKNQEIDLGFIIISLDHNIGRLKSTKNSIGYNYRSSKSICIVPDSTPAVSIKESQEVCPVYKGGKTLLSMINAGFKRSPATWSMIVTEGKWIKSGLDERYLRFMRDTKDILFPVYYDQDRQGRIVHIYNNFSECDVNGLMIHKDTFKEVGNFSDNPDAISKFMWGLDAIDKGCNFKAVVGARI